MTGTAAFFRKEFREILKTYKVFVVLPVFLLVGLMSPILAKLTPDIIKSMAGTTPGLEKLVLPPPVAADAYAQFFKNLNSLATLAVIFTSIGLVVEEKVRGSAVLMMTKPVPRWAFIAGKYLAGAVLIIVSTALAYAACLYYTIILFNDAMPAASAQATLLAAVYFLLILAVTLLASTVSRSLALSGGISVAAFMALSILPQVSSFMARYSPGALPVMQSQLILGQKAFSDAVPALLITLTLTLGLVGLSIALFRRQEL